MKINKSSRHPKITGDFGEALVLYLLSKHGFECALVDHTGIDIIARRPHSKEVMGISVKSRSRTPGKEKEHLAMPKRDFEMAKKACASFGCTPYFALVVDGGDTLRPFLLSLRHLVKLFPGGPKVSAWQMTDNYLRKYYRDSNIHIFEFGARTTNWL